MAELTTDEIRIQGIDTEEWAISAPKPGLYIPTCIDLNSSTTPMVSFPGRNIQGDVIMHLPRYCSITLGHHNIPMRLLFTTKLGRLPSRLSLPTLHSHQLLDLHGAQILDAKMTKALNAAMKDLILSNHKKALYVNATSQDVHHFVSVITKETKDVSKIQPTFNHYHSISWGWLIFLTLVGLVIIMWIRKKFSMPVIADKGTYIVAVDGSHTNPAVVDITAAATSNPA
jgi:hypothetical protein